MVWLQTIPVDVTILGEQKSVTPGTPVAQILPGGHDEYGERYLGAVLNNHLVGLDGQIWTSCTVQPLTIRSVHGAAIYRQSATYLLFAACADIYPEVRLEIGQSMGNGYHFRVHGDGGWPLDLERLTTRMRELVEQDFAFERRVMNVEEAERYFGRPGHEDKVRLLRVWPDSRVSVVRLSGFMDIYHGPVVPSAGYLDDFNLLAQPPGFILHFTPGRSPVWHESSMIHSTRLFESYQETRQWNDILGIRTVGDLNEVCLDGGVRDIIRVTEGFQEKKIARVADDIMARRPDVRLILIAGPSSSGKTTFSKRLSVQLRVNGIRPLTLSLDNYYVDRVATPKHPDGTFDFEALEAIDLPLFNDHLRALLRGDAVAIPKFDFTTGRRERPEQGSKVRLADDQMLVVEGIHGLNDRLTEAVPTAAKFRIFVSALTQLVIDSANRVATSDSRLIRRIVRDRRYRGYSAAQTIATWPSVRQGEQRYIFPFQDRCDVMFNSALLYEPAVLKVLAERYLLEVPRDHPSGVEARVLRRFLGLFVPIYPDDVPPTSILREFIGQSAFSY